MSRSMPDTTADLLLALGRYAVEKGEAWRIGPGAEIMDAYQEVCRQHDESAASMMFCPRRPQR